ncbi:MAG: hypothetical protein EZS28_037184, partial [Streblomastix strix]
MDDEDVDDEIPFNVGDIIKDRYTLVKNISNGENRAIFYAFDPQMKHVALKLELDNDAQTSVCIEAAIMKLLAGTSHFPKFYQFGSHMNYKFLAMEFMGSNLIDLVNYKKPYSFNLHSTLKFAKQAINALHNLHNKGVVHRDIKPGNFVIGNDQNTVGTFYLINFGMCKKLNDLDGVIKMPSSKGNFHGSLMYPSLNAHLHNELGR